MPELFKLTLITGLAIILLYALLEKFVWKKEHQPEFSPEQPGAEKDYEYHISMIFESPDKYELDKQYAEVEGFLKYWSLFISERERQRYIELFADAYCKRLTVLLNQSEIFA